MRAWRHSREEWALCSSVSNSLCSRYIIAASDKVICALARIVEPDGRFHHILQRASGQPEGRFDVFQRPPRLCLDAARNELAVVAQRDLTRHEHERSGLDRRREWQRLAARTRAGSTQEFDAHWILLSLANFPSHPALAEPDETKLQNTRLAITSPTQRFRRLTHRARTVIYL